LDARVKPAHDVEECRRKGGLRSPDFRLNVQRRSDLWAAMNTPRERARIERAKPIGAAV